MFKGILNDFPLVLMAFLLIPKGVPKGLPLDVERNLLNSQAFLRNSIPLRFIKDFPSISHGISEGSPQIYVEVESNDVSQGFPLEMPNK